MGTGRKLETPGSEEEALLFSSASTGREHVSLWTCTRQAPCAWAPQENTGGKHSGGDPLQEIDLNSA